MSAKCERCGRRNQLFEYDENRIAALAIAAIFVLLFALIGRWATIDIIAAVRCAPSTSTDGGP